MTTSPIDSSAMPRHETSIRAAFEAYRLKNRAMIEPLLSGELRFTSPYDDAIDRETYFARCWPNSARFTDVTVERVFVRDDAAYVTYLVSVDGDDQFRNTEYMTFDEQGRIASIHVFFGENYRHGSFEAKRPG